MLTYFWQALTAFGAGLGTSLSPCVYPMIPITVGFLGTAGTAESRGRTKIFAFVTGQVIAFTLLGFLAVTLGEILGFSSEIPWVQIGTGILLLVFAAVSFFDRLPGLFYKLNRFQSLRADTILGSFLVGVSSAAVASPCTSPVIGGVLAAVSQVKERTWGISLMFFFALGLSFLFLILGLGLAKAKSLPRAGLWMRQIQRVSCVLLAGGGVYFIWRGLGL